MALLAIKHTVRVGTRMFEFTSFAFPRFSHDLKPTCQKGAKNSNAVSSNIAGVQYVCSTIDNLNAAHVFKAKVDRRSLLDDIRYFLKNVIKIHSF